VKDHDSNYAGLGGDLYTDNVFIRPKNDKVETKSSGHQASFGVNWFKIISIFQIENPFFGRASASIK
jgi:hypothetical protein